MKHHENASMDYNSYLHNNTGTTHNLPGLSLWVNLAQLYHREGQTLKCANLVATTKKCIPPQKIGCKYFNGEWMTTWAPNKHLHKIVFLLTTIMPLSLNSHPHGKHYIASMVSKAHQRHSVLCSRLTWFAKQRTKSPTNKITQAGNIRETSWFLKKIYAKWRTQSPTKKLTLQVQH